MSEDSTKLQVLRGLGNIASAGVTEVNRYAPTVIDALMCAIDDPNETIAREAINGLSKVEFVFLLNRTELEANSCELRYSNLWMKRESLLSLSTLATEFVLLSRS